MTLMISHTYHISYHSPSKLYQVADSPLEDASVQLMCVHESFAIKDMLKKQSFTYQEPVETNDETTCEKTISGSRASWWQNPVVQSDAPIVGAHVKG